LDATTSKIGEGLRVVRTPLARGPRVAGRQGARYWAGARFHAGLVDELRAIVRGDRRSSANSRSDTIRRGVSLEYADYPRCVDLGADSARDGLAFAAVDAGRAGRQLACHGVRAPASTDCEADATDTLW